MQLRAEKEILIVVATLLHCCAVKKNVIVASQLYDVADVQFTVEKEDPLELLQFIQKYNHGNSVPNIIMLRIFLTIAVSVSTCKRSFSKLKLIKNYLRSSVSTLRLRNLSELSIEHGFSTHFCLWTTMPFQITLWIPVDNQNGRCSYGFFRDHGLYRWSGTKVLLHKKIIWNPSIGHHVPPVEKPCYRATIDR